jgi:small-conductance mechanosensitive channel
MIQMFFREKTAFKRKGRRAFRRVRSARWILFAGVMTATALCWVSRGVVEAQGPSSSAAANAPPQDGDVAERSKAILAHLNSVLRFYRDSQAPIQTVGEPSDLVYRDQAVTLATQIGGYAFESAKAEAALIEQSGLGGQETATAEGQAQKMRQMLANVEQQIAQLKQQDADLGNQISTAKAESSAALEQQRRQVEGELELQTAMADALGKITSTSDTSSDTGFTAEMNQLERSAPGLTSNKPTTAAPTLESLSATKDSGVSSQAEVLFHLLGAREAIDSLIVEAGSLHAQALALQTPLGSQLRETIAKGQALSQTTAAPAVPANKKGDAPAPPSAAQAASTAAATQAAFNQLTATFKALSASGVPLSQEILALEQDQAGLQAWRSAVNDEYRSILRSLLLRVASIAIALLVIFGLGEVWNRATHRYVKDVRRRRQLLVVRRLVTGFLSGLVLIFGLVTQFSSLATFAGFITAGIAVGLQTILLSVAAYFFIIGRYGVKVGDRITIAAVTGDVVEVGLVRFYMMEMAGSGADLYPSGRIAVFSNAVLFQAGTPLYKQMPGTRYGWHELTVKLSSDVDYRPAVQEIVQALQQVYKTYGGQIESQHKNLELWMDSSLDSPGVQSNVQFLDGGLQLWLRFPVILRQAAAIDEKMTEALSQLISSDEKVKAAVSSPPVIKAAVKG